MHAKHLLPMWCVADEASIAAAEARHLFKPKPLADAVTTETTQGFYYTQVCMTHSLRHTLFCLSPSCCAFT